MGSCRVANDIIIQRIPSRPSSSTCFPDWSQSLTHSTLSICFLRSVSKGLVVVRVNVSTHHIPSCHCNDLKPCLVFRINALVFHSLSGCLFLIQSVSNTQEIPDCVTSCLTTFSGFHYPQLSLPGHSSKEITLWHIPGMLHVEAIA